MISYACICIETLMINTKRTQHVITGAAVVKVKIKNRKNVIKDTKQS